MRVAADMNESLDACSREANAVQYLVGGVFCRRVANVFHIAASES